MGLALGEEYIRIAHDRANELTGPIGLVVRSKLRLFNLLSGSSSPSEAANVTEAVESISSLASVASPLAPQAASRQPLLAPSALPAALPAPTLSVVAAATVVDPLPQPSTCLLLANASGAPATPAAPPVSAPVFSAAWSDYLDRMIDTRAEIHVKRRPELKSSGSTLVWIIGDMRLCCPCI